MAYGYIAPFDTPRVPEPRDTATKRVWKDRPVHSYAVTPTSRIAAKQAVRDLRAARRVADGLKGRR